MVRYPHSAVIVIQNETKDADGNFVTNPVEHNIEGRFEPKSQNSTLDYAGKFYCKNLDFEPFALEGKKLNYSGIVFEIYQFQNYQMHCELWLK